MDLTSPGLKHMLKELPDRLSVGLVDEWGLGELARPVVADERIWFAFSSLNFGNVDIEGPYRVALELRPLGFVLLNIRQA